MQFVARSQLQVIDSSDGNSQIAVETSVGFAMEFLKRTNSIWKTASCDVSIVRSLFLKWWDLLSDRGNDSRLVGFKNQTCLAITSVLDNCDSMSAMVVALIQSKPLDVFVLRCLASDCPSGTGLLVAAVRNDPFLLSPKILQNLDEIVTTEDQQLDSLLIVILRRSIDSLSKECLKILLEKVFERIKFSLSKVVSSVNFGDFCFPFLLSETFHNYFITGEWGQKACRYAECNRSMHCTTAKLR